MGTPAGKIKGGKFVYVGTREVDLTAPGYVFHDCVQCYESSLDMPQAAMEQHVRAYWRYYWPFIIVRYVLVA